ncbi:MAG: hypothetical protein HYS81_00740 [Candidatus Aenigmatarchaeota archaeon]|nr:MAG: hypothetical protein HYS81_00740 [Candidatus Aenigmarchaeota archaeon]
MELPTGIIVAVVLIIAMAVLLLSAGGQVAQAGVKVISDCGIYCAIKG